MSSGYYYATVEEHRTKHRTSPSSFNTRYTTATTSRTTAQPRIASHLSKISIPKENTSGTIKSTALPPEANKQAIIRINGLVPYTSCMEVRKMCRPYGKVINVMVCGPQHKPRPSRVVHKPVPTFNRETIDSMDAIYPQQDGKTVTVPPLHKITTGGFYNNNINTENSARFWHAYVRFVKPEEAFSCYKSGQLCSQNIVFNFPVTQHGSYKVLYRLPLTQDFFRLYEGEDYTKVYFTAETGRGALDYEEENAVIYACRVVMHQSGPNDTPDQFITKNTLVTWSSGLDKAVLYDRAFIDRRYYSRSYIDLLYKHYSSSKYVTTDVELLKHFQILDVPSVCLGSNVCERGEMYSYDMLPSHKQDSVFVPRAYGVSTQPYVSTRDLLVRFTHLHETTTTAGDVRHISDSSADIVEKYHTHPDSNYRASTTLKKRQKSPSPSKSSSTSRAARRPSRRAEHSKYDTLPPSKSRVRSAVTVVKTIQKHPTTQRSPVATSLSSRRHRRSNTRTVVHNRVLRTPPRARAEQSSYNRLPTRRQTSPITKLNKKLMIKSSTMDSSDRSSGVSYQVRTMLKSNPMMKDQRSTVSAAAMDTVDEFMLDYNEDCANRSGYNNEPKSGTKVDSRDVDPKSDSDSETSSSSISDSSDSSSSDSESENENDYRKDTNYDSNVTELEDEPMEPYIRKKPCLKSPPKPKFSPTVVETSFTQSSPSHVTNIEDDNDDEVLLDLYSDDDMM